ncbi:DUF421 domain-containing protein [Amantichitinum ursilacus]|uniref:YetF C-terminal domain-containing protein n=1 Tax=Amantichitinum ursilacus TaxID=857265 RepID=A0A0N1JSJ5_9NEIS|nr:YetF domain-containing protein [Amantichitinum ursilacus]KPC52305.1 hypothetical protein WG78_14640 [Amantichitinum ursilacus]
MPQISELIDFVFGSGHEINAGQMAARAVGFFFITLVLIRIAGRRSFGQRSAFDAGLSILLGAILSRAVVAATPVVPTICACAALALTHRAMAWLSVRYPWVGGVMDGDTRRLVNDGELDKQEMRRGLLSQEDLAEAMRQQGDPLGGPLKEAWLERSGKISIRQSSTRDARE